MAELCPGCYPDEDPRIYVVCWCPHHVPDRSGLDDAKLAFDLPYSVLLEGGTDGEPWCDLIHRGRA